jgi:hypothetical protein
LRTLPIACGAAHRPCAPPGAVCAPKELPSWRFSGLLHLSDSRTAESDGNNFCTALVTELGVRWQFGAARPTRQSSCCQSTATIPAEVHISIVSLLANDVRHIAAPSSTRSFETLICHLFRDRIQFCSGLVDLVVCVGGHGGGGHRLALAGERFCLGNVRGGGGLAHRRHVNCMEMARVLDNPRGGRASRPQRG